MFTGILTKILAGALAFCLLAFGGYVLKSKWDEAAYEKQIKKLQDANLALDTKNKAQAESLTVKKKQIVIVRRGKSEEDKVDQVVSGHDDSATRDLFRRYGLLPPATDGDSKVGGRRPTGH